MPSDPFIERIQERPINGRYGLVKKLGAGGFGEVYLASDNETREQVALKLEHHSIDPSMLVGEFRKYEEFQGEEGIPSVYWYGCHDDYRVLAFELLGPSLEDVFAYCGGRLSLKSTLMIIDQLLQRVESLHSRGIIHRDVKPCNFLLGSGRRSSTIYVTDFGLAEESAPWQIDPPMESSPTAHVVGTAQFASIRGHRGLPQSPYDDLESLGYMMVYLLGGTLPWQRLRVSKERERPQAVLEKKMATSAEQLCRGLPDEFLQYMRAVRGVQSQHAPDHRQLRASFRSLARRRGVQYDGVFDWTVKLYCRDMERLSQGEGSSRLMKHRTRAKTPGRKLNRPVRPSQNRSRILPSQRVSSGS